jgi:hypothetical protein
MLTACPQSLHVIKVPLAIFLVVVYIPLGYASFIENAEVLRGHWYRTFGGITAYQKVTPLTSVEGRNWVLFYLCTTSEKTIRVPLSSVVHALTLSASN